MSKTVNPNKFNYVTHSWCKVAKLSQNQEGRVLGFTKANKGLLLNVIPDRCQAVHLALYQFWGFGSGFADISSF